MKAEPTPKPRRIRLSDLPVRVSGTIPKDDAMRAVLEGMRADWERREAKKKKADAVTPAR